MLTDDSVSHSIYFSIIHSKGFKDSNLDKTFEEIVMEVSWRPFLRMRLILFLLTIHSEPMSGQYEEEHRIGCNRAYCDSPDGPTCQPSKECSTIGHRTFLSPSICNCCSYCFDYLEEGAACRPTSSQLPNEMCGPLLECAIVEEEQKTCGTMIGEIGSCSWVLNEYKKREALGENGVAEFLPHCNAHGQFNPRQCLPASSICICMNERGNQIFGMEFSKNLMDCACSRDTDRLDSFGLLKEAPHCLSNGDYDEVQCSLRTRTCYCRMKPNQVVSINDITELPCYDPGFHSESYLRPCESARAELEGILYTGNETTTILIGDFPRCDPDGYYAPVQSNGTLWVCVDRNNIQIESFQDVKVINPDNPLEPPATMDCNCARIRHFLGESATGKPKCLENGSYRPWQCIGSRCYCVDTIGRQRMDVVPAEVHRDDVDKLCCHPVDRCDR